MLFQAKSRKGKTDSVLADIKRSPSPPENAKQGQDPADKPSNTSQNGAATRATMTSPRLRTPPPKQEAFDQFRQEKGKQLNDVMMENKGWFAFMCLSFFIIPIYC